VNIHNKSKNVNTSVIIKQNPKIKNETSSYAQALTNSTTYKKNKNSKYKMKYVTQDNLSKSPPNKPTKPPKPYRLNSQSGTDSFFSKQTLFPPTPLNI